MSVTGAVYPAPFFSGLKGKDFEHFGSLGIEEFGPIPLLIVGIECVAFSSSGVGACEEISSFRSRVPQVPDQRARLSRRREGFRKIRLAPEKRLNRQNYAWHLGLRTKRFYSFSFSSGGKLRGRENSQH
jgi:hypothetical protein